MIDSIGKDKEKKVRNVDEEVVDSLVNDIVKNFKLIRDDRKQSQEQVADLIKKLVCTSGNSSVIVRITPSLYPQQYE